MEAALLLLASFCCLFLLLWWWRVRIPRETDAVFSWLRGRRVVVFGASAGIGASVARLCASHGCSVLVLAARRADRLASVASECTALAAGRCSVRTVVCDVRSRGNVQRTVSALWSVDDEYDDRRCDLLVANAGVGIDFGVAETSPAAALAVVETDLLGPLWALQAAVEPLAAARGRALVVSSMSAVLPRPRRAVYAAAKAGAAALAENFRTEIASRGVSVTVALPGFVRTELAAGISRLGPDGKPLQQQQQEVHRSGRRYGGLLPVLDANECARAIVAAAIRRQRSVVVPWFFSILHVVHMLAPRLYDAALRRLSNS